MMGVERVGPEVFSGERLLRDGTVVVGFLADWCPFCDLFAPELETLAAGGASVLMADVSDEASPLWETFRVEVVPTVIVFRHGAATERADGVRGVGLTPKAMKLIRTALRPRDRG